MIRLTEVAKEYPRSGVALSHISFQVKKGEFVFLTGPSGSGKTTILKLLYMMPPAVSAGYCNSF